VALEAAGAELSGGLWRFLKPSAARSSRSKDDGGGAIVVDAAGDVTESTGAGSGTRYALRWQWGSGRILGCSHHTWQGDVVKCAKGGSGKRSRGTECAKWGVLAGCASPRLLRPAEFLRFSGSAGA